MYNAAYLSFFQKYGKGNMKLLDDKTFYENYLDERFGEFSVADGFSQFKTEHERKQFTRVMDNVEKLYENGLALDDRVASTTTSTGTTNANLQIPQILAPLMRRLMPDLFISQIINTQTLDRPDGRLFFLTPKKGDGTVVGNKASFDRTYARLGEGLVAKNVGFEFTSTPIETFTDKLASEWTLELAVSAKVYMNVNVESEMVKIKATEIRLELEANVLNNIYASATAGNVNWYAIPPDADATTEQKKFYAATLYDAITAANNLIYSKCYVNASWLVTGVDVAERLEKLEKFVIDSGYQASSGVGQMTLARQKMGTLAGRYIVYKDPFFAVQNKILMGFKSSDMEYYAGMIFAPFVPAFLTATVVDPYTFKYSKGFMTWNGMKMVKGDMYATITVLNEKPSGTEPYVVS